MEEDDKLSAAAERVLEELSRTGALSQTDLVERTELARSTVQAAVATLKRRDYIERPSDVEPGPALGGRPRIPLTLTRSAGHVVGIDIGHVGTRVILARPDGLKLAEDELEGPRYATPQRLPDVVDAALNLLGGKLDVSELRGIGVGVAAPVDFRNGKGSRALHSIWSDVNVRAAVRHHVSAAAGRSVEVVVENDANLGALAELKRRRLEGIHRPTFAYLKASEGIGCGLVLDGELHRGPTAAAGEIGHTPVVDRSLLQLPPTKEFEELRRHPLPQCPECHQFGCLQAVASAKGIIRLLQEAHPDLYKDKLITDLIEDARSPEGPVEHPICRATLEYAGHLVGAALAALDNVLDLDFIVVGGRLVDAGDLFVAPLRESVARRQLRGEAPTTVDLDEDHLSGLYGTVDLVLQEVPPLYRQGTP